MIRKCFAKKTAILLLVFLFVASSCSKSTSKKDVTSKPDTSQSGSSVDPGPQLPTSISFVENDMNVIVGSKVQLHITSNLSGYDGGYSFESDHSDIVSVNSTGEVDAKNEGVATIIAHVPNTSIWASIQINVIPPTSGYPEAYVPTYHDYAYQTKAPASFPRITTDPGEVDEAHGVYLATPTLTYELHESGDSYKVTGCTYPDDFNNCVYIPEEYNGKPVTEIVKEAFIYKWFIFSVYIPRTITKIGEAAFSNCGIQHLYYDAENIEDFPGNNWIFFPQLETEWPPSLMVEDIHLVVGPNCRTIPSRFFLPLGTHTRLNPKVSSIEFAENSHLESIGEYAFYNLELVDEIYLPNTLKEIGNYAFYGMSLTELNLPESVTTIGESAFMFCDKISHLHLPNNLEGIGESAFYGCAGLKEVSFANTKVTAISSYSFKNCSSLTYLDLRDVEEIEDFAFENDSSLTTLVIPSSVETIRESAFKGCSGVETLAIGSGVKLIENNAFEGLINVKTVYVSTSVLGDLPSANNVFLNLGKDSPNGIDVIFEKGVTKIASRMFFANGDVEAFIHIRRVYIPKTMTAIRDYAFYGANIDILTYEGKQSEYEVISIGNFNNTISAYEYLEDLA